MQCEYSFELSDLQGLAWGLTCCRKLPNVDLAQDDGGKRDTQDREQQNRAIRDLHHWCIRNTMSDCWLGLFEREDGPKRSSAGRGAVESDTSTRCKE
jgi:hypothetical protein